jgi:DNA-binding response OmpR family regulator
VTKPFLFEEVLARVRTHIALRRAREALAERDERVRELEHLLRGATRPEQGTMPIKRPV